MEARILLFPNLPAHGFQPKETKYQISKTFTLKSYIYFIDWSVQQYTLCLNSNAVYPFTNLFYCNSSTLFSGQPLIPTNITLVCDNPSHIELSWVSNFDGGEYQTFKISYATDGNLSTSYKDVEYIRDQGYGILHSYTTSIELHGAVWFTVTASNVLGKSTSDAVHCTIISRFS